MRQIKYCSNGKVDSDEFVKQVLDNHHVFTQVECIDPTNNACGQCKNSYCVLFEKENGTKHIVTGIEMSNFLESLSKVTKRQYS